MLPCQLRRPPRLLENMMDERRGGGFAVRSGDRNHLGQGLEIVPITGRETAEKQTDVVVDRAPFGQRAGDGGMGLWVKMGDARAGNEGIDTLKRALFR